MKNLKKAFSLITCLAILISALSFSAVSSSAEEPVHVWDGSVAHSFAGGDGSEGNPYLIGTPEQLAYFASTYENAYYKLTNDIYMNTVKGNDFDRKNSWINNQAGFKGFFDGDGHTIYGLYVPASANAEFAGFIPHAAEGSFAIRNLALSHSEFNATNISGAFVGKTSGYYSWNAWNKYISIANCFAYSTVSVNAANIAGGILGLFDDWNTGYVFLNIQNCGFTGTVSASQAGGIMGKEAYAESTVQCCYSTTGRSIGDYNWGNNKHYSSYSNGSGEWCGFGHLPDEQMKGEAANTNMTGFDFDTVWRTVKGGYPELRIFPEKTAEPVKGDVDGDGKLGSEDLTILRKILLSAFGSETPESADVNGDENVDILDLVALKKMIANVA